MKTREIRERLTSMGYERGTLYVLEALNEMQLQTQRDIRELASYFDKMVDSFNGITTVAERMKDIIDKGTQKEEDLGPNTNSLDKEDMQ